jgi:hypothetical protein
VTWPDKGEVLAAQVDRMVVDVLAGDAGRAAYQVWVETRSSGAADLTVGVPAGFVLTGAGRDGVGLLPGLSAEGMVVPLGSTNRAQVVHLAGIVPLVVPADQGSVVVPLPALSAPVSRVDVRIGLPGGREYTVRAASQRGHAGEPPTVVRAHTRTSALGEVLGAGTGAGASYGAVPFEVPGSFRVVEASWSAMSAHPDPVTLEVEATRERKEWF